MSLDARQAPATGNFEQLPNLEPTDYSVDDVQPTFDSAYSDGATFEPLNEKDMSLPTGDDGRQLFPSEEDLFGTSDLALSSTSDAGEQIPTQDSDSGIRDQSFDSIAERFGISPEVLSSAKQLADQFGLGEMFTPANIDKFLSTAQKHGLTQHMTMENLQMAQQYAPQAMQQFGSQIQQALSQIRENPQSALNLISQLIPAQYRGMAMSFAQDLIKQFQ